MNFVYTKVILEEMDRGEILELLIDFKAAVKSVPDNCRRQNLAKVLSVIDISAEKKYWKIILEKL